MSEQGYQDFVSRFEDVCAQYANKTAIVYMRNDGSRTEFTFGKISESVRVAKKKFADVGLQPGDRVAIISPHTPFAVIAGLSLAYANITSVLIDAALPIEEINRLLAFSDVRAVFTTHAIYEIIDRNTIGSIPVFDLPHSGGEYEVFPGSVKMASHSATVDPDLDVITMLFSSGTTASMKGVMITYCSISLLLPMWARLAGMGDKTHFLSVLPFNHVAGYSCVMAFFLNHCEMGMIESVDATKLSKGLQDYQPTHFAMIPRVYEVMELRIRQAINEKGSVVAAVFLALMGISGFIRRTFGINLGKSIFKSVNKQVFGSNIYALASGAVSCKEKTCEFFLKLGLEWANTYATTETGVPISATGVFDRYPLATAGQINRFEGIDIITNAPDENSIGEIRVKSPLIMKGYFRDPELTAAAFDEDGYFKTGDLGYIDRKGYLHVTGRIKEAIQIHTGKKVAPTDVDNFYQNFFPDIALASSGVPCKGGTYDEIHLFVEKGELSAKEQQDFRDEIMELSSQGSTLYQISRMHFIEKLPLTSIGKVKRFHLRDIALGVNEKRS